MKLLENDYKNFNRSNPDKGRGDLKMAILSLTEIPPKKNNVSAFYCLISATEPVIEHLKPDNLSSITYRRGMVFNR
ncbi:hypothetical protein TNCT_418351 [Trichonephila clavata]|uniref:Uncharacterized protein n=1 Tax=Trichonephila clavata TaxID=2740835 RepID=A0A8X6KHF2_TRICU|nr:hypothetical protein TNCT_418351 [Trichonephila clavata]